MEKSSVAAPILSVKTAYSGVQSISAVIQPPPPARSFSPQWESRALPVRQDGYGNEDTPRHSHRSGNPEPFRCAKTVTATKTPPSFSRQWESRALSMRQGGYGNEDTSRHSHRSGNPEPFRCAKTVTATKTPAVILTAVGIQSPLEVPTRLWQRRYDSLARRRAPLDYWSGQSHLNS